MKVLGLAAAAALIAICAVSPAEARRHKQTATDLTEWSEERPAKSTNFWEESDERPARRAKRSRHREDSFDDAEVERPARRRARTTEAVDHDTPQGHGLGGRPGAWCGWYMRTRHGGGPEMNLAWNWSRWGSPSHPHIGAIVVWPHHVGEITGQTADGQWIVLSGNDSGRVRERARSVAGAAFRAG